MRDIIRFFFDRTSQQNDKGHYAHLHPVEQTHCEDIVGSLPSKCLPTSVPVLPILLIVGVLPTVHPIVSRLYFLFVSNIQPGLPLW